MREPRDPGRHGVWIRFYTLDGFAEAENRGWDQGYNFGSHEAVGARWKAAYEASVDLIATDQYEDLRLLVPKRGKSIVINPPQPVT